LFWLLPYNAGEDAEPLHFCQEAALASSVPRQDPAHSLRSTPGETKRGLFCRLKPLFEGGYFSVQTLGEMRAELCEVLANPRHFGLPALYVDAE